MDAHLVAEIVQRHIRRVGTRRMRWGRDDCVLWAAGVARDISGRDFCAGQRWRSRREARRRIALDGDIERALRREFERQGMRHHEPADAPLGALGLVVDCDEGEVSLAVKVSPGWYARRIVRGVRLLPAAEIAEARHWAM